MFDSTLISCSKIPIFPVATSVVMFLFVFFLDTSICNFSLHIHGLYATNQPSYNSEQECSQEGLSSIASPHNFTTVERILWFKKKLPELEIFQSNQKTRQFQKRGSEFLRHQCELHFFMTWLAPRRRFNRRAFMVMESLFKVHPGACLMILSSTLDTQCGSRVLKPLVDLGYNVIALTPDLDFLFKNLPAETWFQAIKSGKKDPGRIPFSQNLSNLIRLAVLYKYGGVYIDTDFLVLKDFSNLRNSIGAQTMDNAGKWRRLNNAVLVFDKGHPLVYQFIEEFATTFNGNKWGHNGPYLVSRVVQSIENSSIPGFSYTILPPPVVYPVDWIKIPKYFEKPNNVSHSKWIEAEIHQLKRQAYGVHLWNRESRKLGIEEGSVLHSLFSDNCVICQSTFSK